MINGLKIILIATAGVKGMEMGVDNMNMMPN